MSGSEYVRRLRGKTGHALLLLPSVAAVIRDVSGRLLLQRKVDGSWSLPAGMIEPGESPEEALVREVLEETGLNVVPSKLLGVFGGAPFRHTYPNGDEVEYTVVLFRCEVVGRDERALDPETSSLHHVERESMPTLALPYPVDLLFGDASRRDG